MAEVIDLFAPSQSKQENITAPVHREALPPVSQEPIFLVCQDRICCGCYFMGWGKQLRKVCRNPEHPGPIREKAFCLNDSGEPSRYAPFDKGPFKRFSYDEMVLLNLT